MERITIITVEGELAAWVIRFNNPTGPPDWYAFADGEWFRRAERIEDGPAGFYKSIKTDELPPYVPKRFNDRMRGRGFHYPSILKLIARQCQPKGAKS